MVCIASTAEMPKSMAGHVCSSDERVKKRVGGGDATPIPWHLVYLGSEGLYLGSEGRESRKREWKGREGK
jgi:hypothetical protein